VIKNQKKVGFEKCNKDSLNSFKNTSNARRNSPDKNNLHMMS